MKKVVFTLLLALAGAVQAASLGEKLRVLSIDLQNARVETPGAPGSELAQELRGLLEKADVDVICVQGARDWENCERICNLKPGLQVLTCSAFEKAPQVGIISRAGAVLAWVDEVERENGFALAILQAGPHKLAVFSAVAAQGTNAGAGVLTERLMAEVNKLQKFPQNRPESFLITGPGLVKTTLLTDSAFQTVVPEPKVESTPEFWVLNGGFLTRPRNVALKGLKTPATLCDFDTSSSFSSKFAYQTPLLFPGETLASLQPPTPAPAPAKDNRMLIWAISIGGFLFVMMLLLVRVRPRASTLQLVPTGNGSPMLPVDDSLRSNLLVWLKSAFLQRLLSQRQQLLNDEAEATRRTMLIEEKLSNLQSALQTRISAYEIRIDRLEQELTAATLDNRELIRAQIELLKEKVAKAKQEHAMGRN
jgi:hypothetical protein